jgi:hypothetical protein
VTGEKKDISEWPEELTTVELKVWLQLIQSEIIELI